MAEYIDRALALYEVERWEEGITVNIKAELKALHAADVIEIPKNATNGDMLIALFGEKALITLDTHNYLKNWWNAPYRKE